MKIILSDIDNMVFPECYIHRKDRFKRELEYIKQIDKVNYLTDIRNIKFIIRIIKLSLTIEQCETRSFIRILYEKLIEISFDWNKPYDWHELKPILMFFTIFSDTLSIRDVEKTIRNRTTQRMLDKYMIRDNV